MSAASSCDIFDSLGDGRPMRSRGICIVVIKFPACGGAMVKATGILDQLHVTQPGAKHVSIVYDDDGCRDCAVQYRVGRNGRNQRHANHIPDTLKVYISESDDIAKELQ